MKPHYTIALRLANVRRFLNARISEKTSDFKNAKDFDGLLEMIQKQRLPVAIREDSMGQPEVVLCERNVVLSKENSKEWYVLACNFPNAREACLWVDNKLGRNRMILSIV